MLLSACELLWPLILRHLCSCKARRAPVATPTLWCPKCKALTPLSHIRRCTQLEPTTIFPQWAVIADACSRLDMKFCNRMVPRT